MCPSEMRRVLLLLLTGCGASVATVDAGQLTLDSGVQASTDSGTVDGGLPTLALDAGVVVWIGAHPDDESMAAQVLSDWCTRARCVFVVLTRGEGGSCGLSTGCSPDLGTVRARELLASAKLFDAGVVQETFSNASSSASAARDVWVREAGGEAALFERVARVLRTERPDWVLTFDPLHGGTCHGEHRAAAAVALVAADTAGISRSRVVLVSSLLMVETPAAPMAVGFSRSNEATHQFSGGQWRQMADVMRAHASQFGPGLISAAENAPARLRTSYFRGAEGVAPADALDTRYCP